jgi:hypothetical protein
MSLPESDQVEIDKKNLPWKPFRDWMSPVLCSIVSVTLAMLSFIVDVPLLALLGMILFSISMLWLLSSAIYLLFKKQWGKSLATFLIIVSIIISIGLLQ